MTDSNERWADSSEKSTEHYGYIKDPSALGQGSDVAVNEAEDGKSEEEKRIGTGKRYKVKIVDAFLLEFCLSYI